MDLALDFFEGKELHGLLKEASDDIVLKLDSNGFITNASENIRQLGEDFTQQLMMPHICDLCDHEYSEFVSLYVEKVLAGDEGIGSIEFPIVLRGDGGSLNLAPGRRWYALSLRPTSVSGSSKLPNLSSSPAEDVKAKDDRAIGAIGLLRSVQRVRLLENELHSRATKDPLTGLSNRHAFSASLRRQLANGSQHCVVVFAVDRMRSLLMQYGQRTADEIQWGFAKFLETMVQPGFELAQLDSERFGVLVPEFSVSQARNWAQEVLDTFSSLALTTSPRMPKLTASAGLASLDTTVDWTLKQAELALVIARAGGGMQVGQCTYQSAHSNRAGFA